MALNGVSPLTMVGAKYEVTETTAQFPVGTISHDNFGGEWIYVKAAEALTVYSLCHITNASIIAGTWLAEMTEASDIATGPKFLGINQVAFASGDYGWLWRGPGGGYNRGIKVRSVGFTAGALAYPDASNAGAVDDDNVDESVIAGLTTLTTTTTEDTPECMATTILTCNLGETD